MTIEQIRQDKIDASHFNLKFCHVFYIILLPTLFLLFQIFNRKEHTETDKIIVNVQANPMYSTWSGGCSLAVFDVIKDGWVRRDTWITEHGPSGGKYSTVAPKIAHCFSFIGI